MMKALITKASDWEWFDVKEVNSVEDVLKIAPRVIIKPIEDGWKEFDEQPDDCEIEIKIYDDWVE